MSSPDSSVAHYRIHLPHVLVDWPWCREISPHYEDCKRESDAWIQSFKVFSPRAQEAFNNCAFSLCAALAYPRQNKEGCRVGCDLMNLFFVFDELSDVASTEQTRQMADIIMDALHDPRKPRPQGEWIGGCIAQEFWLNAIRSSTPSFQKRFIQGFKRYTDSVVQESNDRERGHLRNVETYFDLRRHTIGIDPSLAIYQIHMELPDYVVDHPVIKNLSKFAVELSLIHNDLWSYNVEQSRGDSHNLISIAMGNLGLSIQEAFDWAGQLHNDIEQKFVLEFEKIPSFDDVRVAKEAKEYGHAIGNWVWVVNQWSFESQRYFGTDGLRVMKERTITLHPRSITADKQASAYE